MPTKDPAKQFPPISKDVTHELSMFVLEQMQKKQTTYRFGDDFWGQLAIQRPNLRDFIYAASYSLAPDDTVLRSEVAACLGDVVVLLDRAAISDGMESLWQPKHDKPSALTHDTVRGDDTAMPL